MNAPLTPDRIERWPLAWLKPYASNAKTHDANQVARIAASMPCFNVVIDTLWEANRVRRSRRAA